MVFQSCEKLVETSHMDIVQMNTLLGTPGLLGGIILPSQTLVTVMTTRSEGFLHATDIVLQL